MLPRKVSLALLLGLLFFVLSFIILPKIHDNQIRERSIKYALQTLTSTGRLPSDSEIKQDVIRARESVSYVVFFERAFSLATGLCLGWATADVLGQKKRKDQKP